MGSFGRVSRHCSSRHCKGLVRFEIMPDNLDVIEYGRVFGQPSDSQPAGSTSKLLIPGAVVQYRQRLAEANFCRPARSIFACGATPRHANAILRRSENSPPPASRCTSIVIASGNGLNFPKNRLCVAQLMQVLTMHKPVMALQSPNSARVRAL